MATLVYDSLTDHSVLDDTGDKINGSEVDENPFTLAQILDGTTQVDFGSAGSVYYRDITGRSVAAAAGSIVTPIKVSWDPASGTLTDNVSGVGIPFYLQEDDGTQSIFGQVSVICANDAADAYGGILRFAVADDVDGSLDSVLDLNISALSPTTTDSLALGTTSLMWSDAFFAPGAVLNFNAGDVTLTHSAGKLTWGGDGAVEIDFNNHEMTNVDINSGAIDGTTIGAASAAAGTFTTGTFSGIVSVDDVTDSTSGTTGSIHTDGGVGIAKALYVGTTSTLTGAVSVDDTTDTTSGTTGSFHTDGGVGVAKALYVGTTSTLVGAATVGYGSAVAVDTSVDGDINAKKIIPFDLTKSWCLWYADTDPASLESYHRFRAQEIHTSWYQELGRFPPFGWIAINNGQTAVTIYDGRDGSAWMTFENNANDVLASGTVGSVQLLDGRFWLGMPTGRGAVCVDFLSDVVYSWIAAGFTLYKGDISERNDTKGYLVMNSSPAVVNGNVNAVAAIRDPMGARDSFGRLKHRVLVGTDGGPCVSDAGISNLWDGSITGDTDVLAFLPSGDLFLSRDTTQYRLYWRSVAQSISADAWQVTTGSWFNTQSGAEDLPWTDGAVFSQVGAVEGASIVDKSSPVVLFGSDEGLAISHAKAGDNTNGLTTIIDNVAHWPPYRGTQKFSFALESDAELFGQDLTASGAGVTYTAGVFDNCATFDGTDYLSREGDANLTLGTSQHSVAGWVKCAANPVGAADVIWTFHDDVGVDQTVLDFTTDGYLRFRATDDSWGTNDSITFSVDICDGTWHFVVLIRDADGWHLYVDGELVGSDTALAAAGSLDTVEFWLGANTGGGSQLTGSVDHLVIHIGTAMSADEIRREYHKGLRAMQSGVSQQHLDNADVDYVQVSPTGAYRIVGDESKAYILDDHDIIIATDGPPDSDSIQDAAIWEVPGGYSYVLGASSSIESVQTNPNILEGMR